MPYMSASWGSSFTPDETWSEPAWVTSQSRDFVKTRGAGQCTKFISDSKSSFSSTA
jgi:hypothetical protein